MNIQKTDILGQLFSVSALIEKASSDLQFEAMRHELVCVAERFDMALTALDSGQFSDSSALVLEAEKAYYAIPLMAIVTCDCHGSHRLQ